MIAVTKEQLQARVIVINREMFPHLHWLARNFNANHLDYGFPEQLTKGAAIKRLEPISGDYYGFYCDQTSFYMAYASIAEELIKWVKKLTS